MKEGKGTKVQKTSEDHFKTNETSMDHDDGGYIKVNIYKIQLQLSEIIPPAIVSHENTANGGWRKKLKLVPT